MQRKRLIIIDDNVTFGILLSAILSRHDFEVCHFRSVRELKTYLEQTIEPTDYFIIDFLIGNTGADQVLPFIKAKCPSAIIVLMSGDTSDTTPVIRTLVEEKMIDVFLEKPITADVLLEILKAKPSSLS